FEDGQDAPADCVIFSAADLGGLACEAFNQFGRDAHTANIPALLLADRRQKSVMSTARTSANRKLLELPLKVRELRSALLTLLRDVPRRDADRI
ncbi:MAG: serine/threonine protein kinase, partial [Planctomycetota bacterium]